MEKCIQFSAIAIAAYFLFHFLPDFRQYPYADDWVYTKPETFSTIKDWSTWLFAQHVDHRIPIQKLSAYVILRASSFDFRYLVGVDYLLALVATFNLLYVARAYRGYQSVGDFIIPLICLEYAAGHTQWAFQFQFLFSIVVTVGFVYFCFRYIESKRPVHLALACIAILASTLSGVNGLIAATWCTVAMLGWMAVSARSGWTKGMAGIVALLCACLVIEGAIWITWTPSGATGTQVAPLLFMRFMAGLLPSSMLVYSFDDVWWKTALILALLIGALAIFFRDSLRMLDFGQFVLMVGVGTSFLIIASASIGRAKSQGGWSPGIAMHYGYLSILIPIMCWIVVSKALPRVAVALVGLVLMLVFGRAFQVNLDWRQAWVANSRQHQADVMKAVRQSADPQDVVDRYPLDFTWKDEPEPKAAVVEGISLLRKMGAKPYMYDPASVDHFAPVAAGTVSRICYGSIDLVDGKAAEPSITHTGGFIKAVGWVAADTANGAASGVAFLTLKAAQDSRLLALSADHLLRPDVAAYFKQPELDHAGFEAYGPLDGIKGNFTLGVAVKLKDDPNIYTCKNLNVAVEFK